MVTDKPWATDGISETDSPARVEGVTFFASEELGETPSGHRAILRQVGPKQECTPEWDELWEDGFE